jgi:hypothetical protein
MARVNIDLNQTSQGLLSKLINVSNSGSNTLIAGKAGQIVRVYKLALSAAGAVTVEFLDGINALTGAMSLATGVPLVFGLDSQPWFVGSAGNDFDLSLGSGVQVSGVILFTQD